MDDSVIRANQLCLFGKKPTGRVDFSPHRSPGFQPGAAYAADGLKTATPAPAEVERSQGSVEAHGFAGHLVAASLRLEDVALLQNPAEGVDGYGWPRTGILKHVVLVRGNDIARDTGA